MDVYADCVAMSLHIVVVDFIIAMGELKKRCRYYAPAFFFGILATCLHRSLFAHVT